MRFLDTNILLYSISTLPKEVPKAAIAREILRSRDLVLSVQVLQEFYVQATRPSRADPLSHDEALAFIETWKRFQIVDVTLGLFDEAVRGPSGEPICALNRRPAPRLWPRSPSLPSCTW